MPGYINLVVLENSERAIELQKRWQAYAAEHVTDEGDDPGRCRWVNLEVEGVAHRWPAVWGTSWDSSELFDTSIALAQEMHRAFGEDAPPFLATVHYDNETKLYANVWWSSDEKEHEWWETHLLRTQPAFGHNRPAFIVEQVEVAVQSDMAPARAFRAELRQERLTEGLTEFNSAARPLLSKGPRL